MHTYLIFRLTKSKAKIPIHYFYFSGRLEDKETKGSSEKRTTLTSTLKFRPGIADNLRTVRCEAGHPALPDASLAAELQISVQCKIFYIKSCSGRKKILIRPYKQWLYSTTCLNLYVLNELFDWCTQVPEFWLAENFTLWAITTLRPCLQIWFT